ncbi:MAG: tubulin-like doman-containing protein [Gemmataceae bacterium]
MAIRVQSQAEPIPGYRLIERLGGGGFGEVWKAEAPGGLFKAIKFVYGDIEGADDEGARADQELKALKRVQSVHHPYILSLERYDIIDGQLIIVMELADKTLWDRYKEFRRLGKKGIPRDELLGYLKETAEALDLMNNQYQLQHLDIKPQNLFLVHNHVKVADFGLVKDLEGWVASVTGGVTPVYAAPETFDGWVSRYSDQYSLAIVYQEILTGKRPFAGTTVRQLIVQHLQATPDLSSLPEEDRPAIARALSKTPEQRFPTCAEFVDELIDASGDNFDSLILSGDSLPDPSRCGSRTKGLASQNSEGLPSTGSLATELPPAPKSLGPSKENRSNEQGRVSGEPTRSPGHPEEDRAENPSSNQSGFFPPPLPWEEEDSASEDEIARSGACRGGPEDAEFFRDEDSNSSQVLTGTPTKLAGDELGLAGKNDLGGVGPRPGPEGGAGGAGPAGHQEFGKDAAVSKTPTVGGRSTADRLQMLSNLRTDSDGVLMPTLVIGLGSLGQKALQEYRGQMLDVYGGLSHLPHLRFLYLDADSENLKRSTKGDRAALLQTETFYVGLHRVSHYLKPGAKGDLEKWLPPKMLYRIPRTGVPDGWRALGRLAFIDNYRALVRRLEAELQGCLDPEALKLASHRTSLGIRSALPRVYVITSLGGGTGSGMFIDLGYVVQSILRRLGVPRPDVVGMFLLPSQNTSRQTQTTPAQPNSLAALTELQHFSHPENTFSAFYDKRDETLQNGMLIDTGPPYQRAVLLPLDQGSARKSRTTPQSRPGQLLPGPELAAKLIFTESLTPLGRKAEDNRHAWAEAHFRRIKDSSQRAIFQTCGLHRIHWPRRRLLRRASELLCRRLVEGWMNKDAKALADGIKQWVEQQWEDLDLAPESLIERARDRCAEILGEDPQTTITGITGPLVKLTTRFTELQGSSAKSGSTGVSPVRGRGEKNGAAKAPRLPLAKVAAATHEFEALLGVPEGQEAVGVGPQNQHNTGQVGRALKKFLGKFANECEIKLAELFVRLIEAPQYRLAAAEETIRQFSQLVCDAIEHQEELAKELTEKALNQYHELNDLLENPDATPPKETSGWLSFTRRQAEVNVELAHRLGNLLQSYPKIRYQSLVLAELGEFYVAMRGLLSDQLREIDFCRHRLRELCGKFQTFALEESREGTSEAPDRALSLSHSSQGEVSSGEQHGHFGQFIFPERVDSLSDAVRRLDRGLTPEDITDFDAKIQKLIRKKFKALVQVCMTSTSVLRSLTPAMLIEAEAFLERWIETEDVVQMYFAHLGWTSEEASELEEFISTDLIRLFEEANPQIQSTSGQEFCWLAVPEAPDEPQLREIAKKILNPRLPHLTAEGRIESSKAVDEIVLYRERLHKSLDGFQGLSAATELYNEMAQSDIMTPHTRIDVPSWNRIGNRE